VAFAFFPVSALDLVCFFDCVETVGRVDDDVLATAFEVCDLYSRCADTKGAIGIVSRTSMGGILFEEDKEDSSLRSEGTD